MPTPSKSSKAAKSPARPPLTAARAARLAAAAKAAKAAPSARGARSAQLAKAERTSGRASHDGAVRPASAARPAPAASAVAAAKPETRPRQALGRGLSALIAPTASPTAVTNGFRTLPIERLRPCKDQPRKHFDPQALEELAASVRTQGILQPIVVRRAGDDYEIVAGERRWRAAAKAGLKEVPAMVKELSDVHAMQVALIENIQRADLDPIEEALAYQNLLQEHQLRHEDVAEAVGKNRVTITNSLRLLRLPEPVLAQLNEGKLTAGHARALLALGSEAQMVRLADEVVGRALSVRDTEARAKHMVKVAAARAGGAAATDKKQDVATTHLVERLQRALGARVDLKCGRRGKGRLDIHFASLHQLDGIIDRLCGTH